MRQRRIALISCSNGLGHVRRLLALSLALREQGAEPVLLAPAQKVERLVNALGIPQPKTVDFFSRTTLSHWMDPTDVGWIDDLPTLDDYDDVVSDNLIEILEVRPDAWLSGSFFWHRSLDEFSAAKAEHAERLLRDVRPKMISSDLFAAPYLEDNTRLSRVGLYSFGHSPPIKRGGDVLVSCGTGGAIAHEAEDLVSAIATGPRPISGTVFVEPSTYRADMPEWIRPADFTPEMYSALQLAVIRPGVGSATGALLVGARLFCYYERGNGEMRFNAQRVAEVGVGEDCGNALDAWKAALNWLGDVEARARHDAMAALIDRDGARQAARLIIGGGLPAEVDPAMVVAAR